MSDYVVHLKLIQCYTSIISQFLKKEIKQSTEPDSIMTQTLELPDRKYLGEKMDNMLEQVGNFSRDMETTKKSQM